MNYIGDKNNIQQRTKSFSIQIVKFSSCLPKNATGYTLSSQLIRSSTSIGANIVEAQDACSNKDFLYKINHSLKEAKESKYWLEIITESEIVKIDDKITHLLKEIEEIIKILTTIVKKLKYKESNYKLSN